MVLNLSAALVCCSLLSGSATESPAESLAAIEAELSKTRTAYNVAGLAAIIVQDDKIIAEFFDGLASREPARPVTPTTQWRVGSITKVFTALGVLALERQGKLSLTDPITKHLPPNVLSNPWRRSHPIRIEHLLEHTAGFTDMSRAEFDHAETPPIPLVDALQFRPESRTARWRPGMHSSYSNLGAGIAGRIMEVVTNTSFEDHLRQSVFKPLGMKSANFLPSTAQLDRLATGYDRDGASVIRYWHMLYRPFGGLNLEVRDMAPFLSALIGRGILAGKTVLPSATVERIESPRSTAAARTGLTYGYGLGVYAHQANGHVVHGHGGDADGYLAHFAYSKATRRGYFIVINAFNGDALRALRRPLERAITPATPAPAEPTVANVPHEKWSGHYQAVTWRFGTGPRGSREVSVDGDSLIIDTGSRRRRYLAVADGRYRGIRQPTATVAFVDLNNETVLQTPAGNFVRQPPKRTANQ